MWAGPGLVLVGFANPASVLAADASRILAAPSHPAILDRFKRPRVLHDPAGGFLGVGVGTVANRFHSVQAGNGLAALDGLQIYLTSCFQDPLPRHSSSVRNPSPSIGRTPRISKPWLQPTNHHFVSATEGEKHLVKHADRHFILSPFARSDCCKRTPVRHIGPAGTEK
jgi:hypothetical protein